jgi:ADP-heptose:LPS heptosyltransferase
MCLQIRLVKQLLCQTQLAGRCVAFCQDSFKSGIISLQVFDEVFGYSERCEDEFDRLVDLTSYDYSFEIANRLKWNEVFRRDLNNPAIIVHNTKNGSETLLACPALSKEFGWFFNEPEASAAYCELPLLNLAFDFDISRKPPWRGILPVVPATDLVRVGNKRVIGLLSGANIAKHVPLDIWCAIKQELQCYGYEFLAVIGPDEEWLMAKLADNGIPFEMNRSLSRLIEMINGSVLSICNDCGPMHVSLLLGHPTLGVFGPTFAEAWFMAASDRQCSIQSLASMPLRTETPAKVSWAFWPNSDEIARLAFDLASGSVAHRETFVRV